MRPSDALLGAHYIGRPALTLSCRLMDIGRLVGRWTRALFSSALVDIMLSHPCSPRAVHNPNPNKPPETPFVTYMKNNLKVRLSLPALAECLSQMRGPISVATYMRECLTNAKYARWAASAHLIPSPQVRLLHEAGRVRDKG